MRLDKFISQTTDYSRKDVKRLLKEERVTLDGKPITNPAIHLPENPLVCIDGLPVEAPRPRYFMLFKPKGYVCATKDSEHPVVIDLLDEPNKDKLQIAGRLDLDTTGLVLITDNGQWNHAVTAPRRECNKVYYVVTRDNIPPEAGEKFAKGIFLEGEKRRAKPASLEIIYANEARLTISEGKYHQVKRMFATLGNQVEELHREAVGAITLDKALEPGEYRALSDTETNSIW